MAQPQRLTIDHNGHNGRSYTHDGSTLRLNARSTVKGTSVDLGASKIMIDRHNTVVNRGKLKDAWTTVWLAVSPNVMCVRSFNFKTY